MFTHAIMVRDSGPPEVVEHRIDRDGEPWMTLALMHRGVGNEPEVDTFLEMSTNALNAVKETNHNRATKGPDPCGRF